MSRLPYYKSTFTPGVAFGGGTTGITYTTQTGEYTKVGNLIFFTAFVTLSNKGSSTGNATLTGLPFTTKVSTTQQVCMVSMRAAITLTANYTYLTLDIPNAVTTANIMQSGSGVAIAQLTHTAFANTSSFEVTGIYTAA